MKKEYDFRALKVKNRGAHTTKENAKVLKSFRIDADVLLWLEEQAEKRGIGYQTLLNMLLREQMNAQENALVQTIRAVVRAELRSKRKRAA